MERIEWLVMNGCQTDVEIKGQRVWIPAIPMRSGTVLHWIADAWAVLTGRATAVQWPHQRKSHESS